MPIDILTGCAAVREWVSSEGSWRVLDRLAAVPPEWWQTARRWLLY